MAVCTPNAFLDAVSACDPRVLAPQYDRARLVPSVVHIGVGSFHRAHQALYFDELAATGDYGWGLVGVGLRSREMSQVLRNQDGMFMVVERDGDGECARLVGSQTEYHFAPDDPELVIERLADSRTRLVTLTVTGEGYMIGAGDGFAADDPAVAEDLAHPERPETMVGYLVEALSRRRQRGRGPFTVLSCDNMPQSGEAAQVAVTSFARLRDAGLADWIGEHVTFPASMVDRITPETSPETRREVAARFGIPDQWPVITESFRQWVIEDRFCNGRPPLDCVGVAFVGDVAPYKLIKSRVLNGGHSAIGYLGSLLGYGTTDEAMRDPVLRRGLERMLVEEVAAFLPEVPGMELEPYIRTTLQRFSNTALTDTLGRLCRRGSTKVPSYLLPSLRDARRSGGRRNHIVIAVAAWLRYLRGVNFAGCPVQIEDAIADELQQRAASGGNDPRPLLQNRQVFGDLIDDEVVVQELGAALRSFDWGGADVLVRAGWGDACR